jgi:hypothetical protein
MLINFACSPLYHVMNCMNLKLRISRRDYTNNLSSWNHLRFAVVDLNKSKSYPENFVSMLPMKIDSDEKLPSVFTKFFGNESVATARGLLTEALKTEDDSEIKTEITRRLNLLEPNPLVHIKCRVCKKFFQTQKERAGNQKICPECMKRYHNQE